MQILIKCSRFFPVYVLMSVRLLGLFILIYIMANHGIESATTHTPANTTETPSAGNKTSPNEDPGDHYGHGNYSKSHVECARQKLVCHHYNRMTEPTVNFEQVKKRHGIDCKKTTYAKKRKYCTLPVHVKMDILQVREINEDRGVVRLLMVFRQNWQDDRIQTPVEYLDECPQISEVNNDSVGYVPSEASRTVWFPDVYISRVEDVYQPKILVDAQTFRVNRQGNISNALFGIFTLSCPMNFRTFPMDVQYCPLYVESWRLVETSQRILWHPDRPIGVAKDYNLDQHSFRVRVLKVEKADYTSGAYSRIGMALIFSRKLQFYILQIYFPTVLFVIISWLTFIIPPLYAQGRIILTITTLLTLAALFSLVSVHSPSTSYLKAIDVWMFVCFTFVFVAVVDCLIDIRFHFIQSQTYKEGKLNFLTPVSVALVENREVFDNLFRRGKRRTENDDGEDSDPKGGSEQPGPSGGGRLTPYADTPDAVSALDPDDIRPDLTREQPPDPAQEQWSQSARTFEKWSLIVYPIAFLLFNIVYWAYYLNASGPPSEIAQELRDGFTPEPREIRES